LRERGKRESGAWVAGCLPPTERNGGASTKFSLIKMKNNEKEKRKKHTQLKRTKETVKKLFKLCKARNCFVLKLSLDTTKIIEC
jgi:hypothetical protein